MAPRRSSRSRARRTREVKVQKHNRTEHPSQLVQAIGDRSDTEINQTDLSPFALEIRRNPHIMKLNAQPLRRSPRLVGKVIDYRPMLGMRVPKPRKELSSTTPRNPATRRRNRVTCMIRESNTRSVSHVLGSAQRSAPIRMSAEETPQGRKRKKKERRRAAPPQAGAVQHMDTPLRAGNGSRSCGVLSLNTSLNVGSETSQKDGIPQRRTKQLVLVRTTTTRTCNHENMTHDEIVASRNRAICGRWLTMVRTAFQELRNYPQPFSMQDIRNVVTCNFPGVDSEQFKSAVDQLIHRVTECYGSSGIRRDPEVAHALSYE
ncbi:hypothetical protein ANCCAN_21765 [Ancylostoma caninum]|uniref:Uncharacterized protein n=1 Tax=Ancylostoma caninum TaxID=29170 RepID=A0A368FNL5_ANCCA|nr:hypothetical protein ANCCAN_21765 [Ancylostoma caninum]